MSDFFISEFIDTGFIHNRNTCYGINSSVPEGERARGGPGGGTGVFG